MKKYIVFFMMFCFPLLTYSSSGYDRFTKIVSSGENWKVTVMHKKEDPAKVRAKMNTPEVQVLIQKLKKFLDSQKKLTNNGKGITDAAYVGAEYCLACHDKADVKNTKHFRALRRPMAKYSLQPGWGVVADYDQNGVDDFQQGLDFNQIESAFDQYKPNAPILSYDAETDTYYITIGELKMPVVLTQGGTGDWKQRYLVRVPVTDTSDGLSYGLYVSPVQFNEKTHEYVTYHASDWYDENNLPKFDSSVTTQELAANNTRQYSKKCIGCHTTGIKNLFVDQNGEWHYEAYPASLYNSDDPTYADYNHDGIVDLINIQCEACHGPGAEHILNGGDPDKIVNPADLTTKQINEICAQCHVRVKSVPNGTHDWPMNDETYTYWRPGSDEDLSNFYTDAAGYWGDGINSKQHHQQSFDFDKSGKPTFPYHMVNCVECHDAHGSQNNHDIVEEIVEETDNGLLIMETKTDNNTLCLACHATHGDFESITKEMVADYENNKTIIGEIISNHTHHPYGPERSMGLSRCTKCHMPKIAKSAIEYDIHSHTFECIAPQKTVEYVMPNSCAVSCHNTKVNSFDLGLDPDPTKWDEQFDLDLASKLSEYFGIGGKWWDTSVNENTKKK